MRKSGHRVEQLTLAGGTANGTFVAPTIVELTDIGELEREVFGPVLHVVRFRRAELDGLVEQLGGALAGGNDPVIAAPAGLAASLAGLPEGVAHRLHWAADWRREGPYAGALIEGDAATVADALAALADLPGPIVLPQASGSGYRLDWLVEEVSTSINTTAAGGNASLMVLPTS
jgi:delta 1-pyrroline-5-carboxylate dehydrogenase